ncbi:hypothetical protein ACWEKT_30860 [Nocardia takedensis]
MPEPDQVLTRASGDTDFLLEERDDAGHQHWQFVPSKQNLGHHHPSS